MKVASTEKTKYKGELLTANQWKKKGYEPKEGEKPEKMWANQNSCGERPSRGIFDYFYDYQMKKTAEV